MNHDTLPTAGVLDLTYGPQVLHVPEMAGRYYCVQFTAPNNTIFRLRRQTHYRYASGRLSHHGTGLEGTSAERDEADFVANNSVFVIGRVLVYSDSDLPIAYALAKQIEIVPRLGR